MDGTPTRYDWTYRRAVYFPRLAALHRDTNGFVLDIVDSSFTHRVAPYERLGSSYGLDIDFGQLCACEMQLAHTPYLGGPERPSGAIRLLLATRCPDIAVPELSVRNPRPPRNCLTHIMIPCNYAAERVTAIRTVYPH